jgi:hypothetical protein
VDSLRPQPPPAADADEAGPRNASSGSSSENDSRGKKKKKKGSRVTRGRHAFFRELAAVARSQSADEPSPVLVTTAAPFFSPSLRLSHHPFAATNSGGLIQ